MKEAPGRARPLDYGLRRYDRMSLLRGAAALTLWLPNADRVLALDALSAAIIASPKSGAQAAGVSDWRRWLESGASAQLRATEPDGFNPNPSVVQAAAAGVDRELIGGFLDAPDLVLGLWVDALTRVREQIPDAGLGEPLALLLAVAAISDRISRRGQLWNTHSRRHELRGSIGVPHARSYRELIQALTFSRDERELLGPAIDPLFLDGGTEIAWRPLITWRGGFVVVRPAELLTSAIVRASEAVSRSARRKEVLSAVAEASVTVVRRAGEYMGWRVVHDDPKRVYFEVDHSVHVVVDICVLAPVAGDLGEMQDADGALRKTLKRQEKFAKDNRPQGSFVAVLDSGRPLSYTKPSRTKAASPIVMRLGDFRLLGDALRHEPFALARALAHVPPPPWPKGNSIIDIIGIARAMEEGDPEPEAEDARLDGIEYLHRRARVMVNRHAAPAPTPAPDGPDWIDVVRWSGTPDDALYTSEPEVAGAPLLVRHAGSFIWVAAADPQLGPHHVVNVVCRSAAFWLARLRDAGWSMRYDAAYGVLLTFDYDKALSEPLTVESQSGGARFRFGRAFVEMLCRPDNSADRLLIETIATWWSGLAAEKVAPLVDLIAPVGRGTLTLWPGPDIQENEPRLREPPLVSAREHREIERHVIAVVFGDIYGAIVPPERAEQVLTAMLAALTDLIDGLLAPLGDDALLELLRVNERARFYELAEELSMPARAGVVNGDRYFGEVEPPGERGLAIRSVIEWLVARRAKGSEPLSLRTQLRLRAAAELFTRWGSLREAVRTKLVSAQLGLS